MQVGMIRHLFRAGGHDRPLVSRHERFRGTGCPGRCFSSAEWKEPKTYKKEAGLHKRKQIVKERPNENEELGPTINLELTLIGILWPPVSASCCYYYRHCCTAVITVIITARACLRSGADIVGQHYVSQLRWQEKHLMIWIWSFHQLSKISQTEWSHQFHMIRQI